MQIKNHRREFIKKAGLLAVMGASGNTKFAEAFSGTSIVKGVANGKTITLTPPPSGLYYEPLSKVAFTTSQPGEIVVLDGEGNEYYTAPAAAKNEITAGGALGTHFILLKGKKNELIDIAAFKVNCHTNIKDDTGEFEKIGRMLYYEMCHYNEYNVARVVRLNGKTYHYFSSWFQDHMYVMQGQKYFYPELKSGVDLYFEGQREDGMFHDNFKHSYEEDSSWSRRFDYGNFVSIPNDKNATAIFVRIPLENIAEFSMIEGTYFTWKATGDDEWMKEKLDGLIKGVTYITTNPYRWSEKYQLIKKGYSIDIWDFQNFYDAALVGGDVMKVEPGKTPFGILYADNVRMAYSCQLLAEMLDYHDRHEEAQKIRTLGKTLKERIDRLAWNGEFYTHWIPEDPSRKYDFGVDEKSQVTISNTYALTRGITHEQAVSIIKTYQRIRKEMPASSPGEWYMCYPPFERGWSCKKWTYMNGGVSPIVAGELAKGAFEHGFEDYGVDILRRVYKLVQDTGGNMLGGYRGAFPNPPARNFDTISLRPVANADTHGTGTPGVPGFTGEGDNDLHEFPAGKQIFEDIPFDLLDPVTNGRKACLILSGSTGYMTRASLKINKKASSVYLLTASSKTNFPGYLIFHYHDKTTRAIPVSSEMAGNWWNPSVAKEKEPKTKVAWRGANAKNKNIGVYVSGIDNPAPEKIIDSLEFNGPLDEGKWIILGLTLSDAPVFFMPEHRNTLPSHWAAAECYAALIEGLAGVHDAGTAFNKVRLTPRWEIAGTGKAEVTAKYEASGGYVSYRYQKVSDREIQLLFTGNARQTQIEMLLPRGKKATQISVNGEPVSFTLQSVENSTYACFEVKGTKAHKMVLFME